MKLLPDYLIKYMPAIEEAIEELRLSVIDHAYELIQALDIDELTSDDIKNKLELYDIKTDNMSNEWLPNGKFYRLFASIQHHRTRLNSLKAISRSGGQFEGLWTDDFKYKTSYNYKSIQILRHYDVGSNLDGYFYIGGNTDRNPDGTIRSSARTALLNDIILSHTLPAGYTYLYLPWPRPSYPLESGYFYNINMLAYDRLVYEKDCCHQWLSLAYLGEEYSQIYYCPENHSTNQYFDRNAKKYGSDKDDCSYEFTSNEFGDREFYSLDSLSAPASTNYDWLNGIGTPWRTPYWIDYHYMNDMRHSNKTWPVIESGKYYAFDKYNEKYEVSNPQDAVLYELDNDCLELRSSSSVFPSRCNSHIRYVLTPPNRKSNDAYIKCAYDEYSLIVKQMPSSPEEFIANSSSLTGYSIDVIKDKLSNVALGHEIALKSYISRNEAECILNELTKDGLDENCFEIVKLNSPTDNYSPDEYYHINDSTDDPYDNNVNYVNYFGPYRHDALLNRASHIRYNLDHFKQYKPFWNEKAPFADMNQRTRLSELNPNYAQQNSLYYQFYLKQSNNRPQLSGDIPDQNREFVNNIIANNEPPVSEETFTSYDKPTMSTLDRIYIGYLTSDSISGVGITDQGDNYTVSSDYLENKIYYFDCNSPVEYDPTLYYNIVSLGYRDESGVDQYNDCQTSEFSMKSYLYGNPATGGLFLNKLNGYSYPHDKYNYVTYKTSRVHKAWFSSTHGNKNLSNGGELYNQVGSVDIYDYTSNSINLEYTIVGIYDKNGKPVKYNSGSIYCSVKNNKYSLTFSRFTNNEMPISAAYILFTVKVILGSMDEINASSITADVRVHHSGTIPAMIHGKVTEIAKEEN